MTFQSARIDARLTRALAISFVLHILLLWPTLPQQAVERVAAPLSATLRTPERPVEPAMAVKREMPVRPHSLPAPLPVLTRPEPAPTVAAPTAVAVAAEPAAAPPAVSPTPAGGALRPAAPTPAPANGLDADGLRQFRLALAREARRFKRYPPRALEAGWSGTAEVRLTVAVDAAAGAELIRTSGHDVLDEVAVDMLRRAASSAPMPASLRGRAFAVSLPVVFELPD